MIEGQRAAIPEEAAASVDLFGGDPGAVVPAYQYADNFNGYIWEDGSPTESVTNTTTITYPPDANGAVGTARMVYDGYGKRLSATDPLNHTTTNAYDANHNLTSVTDPLGHTTTYTYDANGNRTSVRYPATPTSLSTTSTTAYNPYGEPTTTTDEYRSLSTP